jgi:ABC-type Fe3+ transport system substrate-binding protein
MRSKSSRTTRTILLVGAAVTLAACGGGAESDPEAAAPAPTEGSSAACADAPGWSDLVSKAKAEGEVVLSGPPSAEIRSELPAAFEKEFGVKVTYIGGSTSELTAKLTSERAAKIYSHDVFLAGANSLYGVAYKGQWLADLDQLLLDDDDLRGDDKWLVGSIPFKDPDKSHILQVSAFGGTDLMVNSEESGDVDAWEDLLEPEFRGKIVALDPRETGAGLNTGSYLAEVLGRDVVEKLYVEQEMNIVSDERQAVDGLARGTYLAAISLPEVTGDEAIDEGLPVKWVVPDDAPRRGTASNGLLAVVEPAAHPNAAALMANWLACPEGNSVWTNTALLPSARTDVEIDDPTPGVELRTLTGDEEVFDTYAYDFVTTKTEANRDWFRQILGS